MTNDPKGTLSKTSSVNWYLVTSHLNLYYMMAAGLILPESGFGKKYYKDLLSLFPGYIVLFADTVPARAIEMVKEETSHLIPCIAQVFLETLTGPVISIDRHGNVRQDISFPNELDGSEAALIIPAPLPISWMDRMLFDSQVSLNFFKESAGDFENVDLRFFGLKVNKKIFHSPKRDAQLFETQDAFPWSHAKNLIKDVSIRLNKSFAAGGILAMLHKMADRSSSAAIAFQLAFHPDVDIEAGFKLDPLIHRPWQWGQEDLILAAGDDLSTKMFWGVVDAVADCIGHEDIHPNDAVFNFLKNVVDTWQEVADNEKLKNALQTLIEELASLTHGFDSTISELLDRHPKPFSRAVILFFLRDNCQGLLEYHNEKLNTTDSIAAAILFGARAGWLALPGGVKGSKTLQHAVVHRMAAMAHHLSGTGIDLGEAPPPPPIFRDLFKPVDNKWTIRQKRAALALSKQKHWDCIQTVIDLDKGEYQLRVGSAGLQIVIAGTEKKVSHEVDWPLFLKKLNKELSKQDISGRLNRELQNILGCTQ